MNITHISTECYPIAKIGRLADVLIALLEYQNKLGVISNVIIPFYNNEFAKNNLFKTIYESEMSLGFANYKFKILTLKKKKQPFDIFLVDIHDLLFKEYVYSNDDTDRFLAFQIAALDWILQMKEKPTILNCHDHHTGLIPFMMSHCYKYEALKEIPSVLTIHNTQYQGQFSHDHVFKIPPFEFFKVGLLDWNQTINPLASGIKCAWKVNTVSRNHMDELNNNAHGLEGLLSHESGKCSGNLIDLDINLWNPESDNYMIINNSKKTVQ